MINLTYTGPQISPTIPPSDLTAFKSDTINVDDVAATITDYTYLVALMLEENIEFVEAKGMTEKAKQSRQRLLKLLQIGETFNTISYQNKSLQLYNKELYAELVKLRAYKAEIERQEKIASTI